MSAGVRTTPTYDCQPAIVTLTDIADADSAIFTNPGYAGAIIDFEVDTLTGTSVVFSVQGHDPNDTAVIYALGTGDATAAIAATGHHRIIVHPSLTAAAASGGLSVVKHPMPYFWSIDINVTSITALSTVVSVTYFS